MAEANPQSAQLAQMLMFSPQTNAQLVRIQQQQALANALLQQGTTPIDTNNRSIGGVGYKISPTEGLAKLADALTGAYGEKKTINDMSNLAGQMQSGQGANSSAADGVISKMPSDLQASVRQMLLPESMGGNPRAAASLISTFAGPTGEQKNFGSQMPAYVNNELGRGFMQANPGTASMQSAMGTAAAGMQPAGTLPQGAAGGVQPQNGQSLPPPPTPAQMPTQTPGAQISPINASDLQPPAGTPVSGNPPPVTAGAPQAAGPAGPATMSAPMAGETNDAYQARMAASKAGAIAQAEVAPAAAKAAAVAQAEVAPAGEKKTSEEAGQNLADAQKTFNVAASNLPRAMQRFSQLRQASQDASYGGGVSEEDPGSMMGDYARNFARTQTGQYLEPKVAIANQVMEQATKQGVMAELGPQMAGLKGNKFLEGIASGASGLNLADPPATKVNAINGLQDQYISNLKSLAQQRRTYGDPSAPSDMDLATLISQNADPSTMISVVDPQGRLGRVAPQHLTDLIQAGGQLR